MNWQTGTPVETGMYYVRLNSYSWTNQDIPQRFKEIRTMSFYKDSGWCGSPEYSKKIADRIIGWCPVEYFGEEEVGDVIGGHA